MAATTTTSDSVTITLSNTVPSANSQYVDISFAGFGIEPSNLFAFTGADTANELSVNLLSNLANYTGKYSPTQVLSYNHKVGPSY